MAKGAWLATLAAAIGIGGAEPAAADQGPGVVVHLTDWSSTSAPLLAGARRVVSEIFSQSGIPLDWDHETNDRAFTVVIVDDAEQMNRRVEDGVMGFAMVGAGGERGRQAYVFAARARQFAQRGRAAADVVLGCAIAHELGHLLLPVNAHSRDGIMRAEWDRGSIPQLRFSVPGFAPDQARLIRARLETLPTP